MMFVSILPKAEYISDAKGYQCLCCREANTHTLTTNMYPSLIFKTLFSFPKGTCPTFTFQEKFTSIALVQILIYFCSNLGSIYLMLFLLNQILWFCFWLFFFPTEMYTSKKKCIEFKDTVSPWTWHITFRNFVFKITADLQPSLRRRPIWMEMVSLDINTVF